MNLNSYLSMAQTVKIYKAGPTGPVFIQGWVVTDV